jgi:predicted ribosomally synthesized peptide with SipW-like signal peptide
VSKAAELASLGTPDPADRSIGQHERNDSMDDVDARLIERRRRRRRRGLVVLLLTFALASLGAGMFSLALFTDTDASDGSFTAGTIDINTTPVTLFTVNPVMPGDSGSATLTVRNDGTAQLRYMMDSTSTNTDGLGLRSALNLTITAGTCPGAGAPLYSGLLWGPVVGATFGDITVGGQAGDRVLNAGTTENLCFAWDLPIGTGNGVQGATTTATFTFHAEQTANN